jgi:hypothetical protein
VTGAAVMLQSNCWRLCLVVFSAQGVSASEPVPTRLYDIVTEIGMPHLEENLRYAVTRETRCVSHRDLASMFPVLSHASLADCALGDESREGETISYRLVCDGGYGTTGSATWRLAEQVLRGTLDVKLGGKNMTFYQRVTATVVGDCPGD